MKKNYKIILNQKRLTSDEIAKFKNFDALMEQYQTAKPPVRSVLKMTPRLVYISSAVAAGFALLLYFIFGFGSNYSQMEGQYFANRDFIDPPIVNVKPQFASYRCNANKGGVYEYESGSKLRVPSAAFVDNNGKTVEGEVEIKYREFHDYVDFFLSGIPMTYDSAGVSYTLESAGMMEIYAEKDGKRVKMAPGKTIAVELVSNVNVPPLLNKPPNYNIYRLDSESRKWIYEDLDKMQLVEDEVQAIENDLNEDDPLYPIKRWKKSKTDALNMFETNELAKIEETESKPVEPLEPQKNNGETTVISLDIDELDKDISKEYEEAKRAVEKMSDSYTSLLWQKSPKSNIPVESIMTSKDGTPWDGMRIRKLNNRDFELTLIKGNEAIKVLINPVLSGDDYELAMSEYNQQMIVFNNAIEAREERLTAQKAELSDKIERQRQAIEDEYQTRLEEFQKNGQDYAATQHVISRKVINRFEATSFGIWNCDRPLPPHEVNVKAKFTDQHGKLYTNQTAYLVDKSRNTVTKFLATDGTELRFNLNSENLLWVVNGNKLAVFRPEDFKRINKPKGSHEFVLDLDEREVKSEKDAREILYF